MVEYRLLSIAQQQTKDLAAFLFCRKMQSCQDISMTAAKKTSLITDHEDVKKWEISLWYIAGYIYNNHFQYQENENLIVP